MHDEIAAEDRTAAIAAARHTGVRGLLPLLAALMAGSRSIPGAAPARGHRTQGRIGTGHWKGRRVPEHIAIARQKRRVAIRQQIKRHKARCRRMAKDRA